MNIRNHKIDHTLHSEKCEWYVICREEDVERDLLKNSETCPVLAQCGIEHIGVMSCYAPYEVFRANQSGTFLLACTEGEGEVLINGQWKTVKKGQACLFPPYMTNAFKANGSEKWEFAWVRYVESPKKKTVANVFYPRLGDYPAHILKGLITGLGKELQTQPSGKLLSAWANLIHQQVLRFSQTENMESRLHKVFSEVIQDVAYDWNLESLASRANLSSEHLRRLCNDQLGRSPMQQVAYIRIAYAKELLMKTNDTVEAIARKIGYKSAFSFSNTFLKWVGCRPSNFR